MSEPDEVTIWYDDEQVTARGRRWRARSSLGGNRKASRITYTRPNTPERAAFEQAWREYVIRRRHESPTKTAVYTVGALCQWFADNPPPTWGEGNTKSMRSINRVHIQPYPIADRPFREAIPAWFHTHVNGIDGASRQTRRHVRQFLHGAYRAASLEEDGSGRAWWDKENPLAPVQVITGTEPVRRIIPTPDQIRLLLDYMKTGEEWDLLRAGLAMAWTGMRPSEWCALEWADIDFETRAVDVSKAVKAATQNVGKTKTRRGERLTYMPAVSAAVMVEWRGYAGGDRFVFPHVGRTNFDYTRPALPSTFAKALLRAKRGDGPLSALPHDLTLYGIRHLQVSRLTEGMSPGEAASVAGHSPSMSIDHYTQSLTTGSRAAEIWDEADRKATQ